MLGARRLHHMGGSLTMGAANRKSALQALLALSVALPAVGFARTPAPANVSLPSMELRAGLLPLPALPPHTPGPACDAASPAALAPISTPVAVITHEQSTIGSAFWRRWRKGAEDAAGQLGVSFSYRTSGYDAQLHARLIDHACDAKYLVSVVVTVPFAPGTEGYNRSDCAIKRCLHAKRKVVTANTGPSRPSPATLARGHTLTPRARALALRRHV